MGTVAMPEQKLEQLKTEIKRLKSEKDNLLREKEQLEKQAGELSKSDEAEIKKRVLEYMEGYLVDRAPIGKNQIIGYFDDVEEYFDIEW